MSCVSKQNNKNMNIIQPWNAYTHSHGVSLCLTFVSACRLCFVFFTTLFISRLLGRKRQKRQFQQTNILSLLRFLHNKLLYIRCSWQNSDPHLDSDSGTGGCVVRGELITIRPINLANASQVINAHYITWLHHNYEKQGLKSNFKRIIISVDCDINIPHFH